MSMEGLWVGRVEGEVDSRHVQQFSKHTARSRCIGIPNCDDDGTGKESGWGGEVKEFNRPQTIRCQKI